MILHICQDDPDIFIFLYFCHFIHFASDVCITFMFSKSVFVIM